MGVRSFWRTAEHDWSRRARWFGGHAWAWWRTWFGCALAIFLLTTAAEGLSIHFIRPTDLDLNGTLIVAIFGGLLSTVALTASYRVFADSHAAKWQRVMHRLRSRVIGDNGFYSHGLEIKTRKRRELFEDQFASIPRRCSELFVVLRQKPRKDNKEDVYDVATIRDQVDKLLQEKRFWTNPDRDLADATEFRFRYAVFVDRHGRAYAYQPFWPFAMQILSLGHVYAELLNLEDESEFASALEDHSEAKVRDLSTNIPDRGKPTPGPLNYISYLAFDRLLTEDKTNLEALVIMRDNVWNQALLTTRGDKKPVAMVSVDKLIGDALLDEAIGKAEIEKIRERAKEPPEPPPPSATANIGPMGPGTPAPTTAFAAAAPLSSASALSPLLTLIDGAAEPTGITLGSESSSEGSDRRADPEREFSNPGSPHQQGSYQ